MNHILKTTEDGSHTFYVPQLDEHYHSTHGAIQESGHIFIEAGLKHLIQNHPLEAINIIEIGFGTGLNAFMTMLESNKIKRKIFYQSMELFPLPIEDARKLNYSEMLPGGEKSNESFLYLHSSDWEKEVAVTPYFTLLKQQIDFSEPSNFNSSKLFNLIYFDAFAPEKQPEMWTREIFDKIGTHCQKGAVLTTYCAKGAVRRRLQSAGFTMERLPGPPGKREMLRGTIV